MKILKIVLLVIGIIILGYLALCFAGPKKMETTSSILINASPESVFEEIGDFKQWEAWSPWHNMDSTMKTQASGEPLMKGHKQTWTSKNMGDGSQEFVEVRRNEYIRSELIFKDWDGANYASFLLTPKGEATEVTWTMEPSDIPFMFRGMVMLIGGIDRMKADYENGLASLKKVVEAKPKMTDSMAYEIMDIQATPFIGQRHDNLNMDKMDASLFSNTYRALLDKVGGQDKVAGAPFCIGRKVDYNTKMMDMEMCYPLAAEIPATTGFTTGTIPAGRAVKFVYTGPYDGTAKMWMPLYDQITKDGLTPRWDGYEVYVNDPEVVKDPSQFITWLVIPIQ